MARDVKTRVIEQNSEVGVVTYTGSKLMKG